MPVDLGPGEIDARLGSAWIAPADVAAFGREVLECSQIAVEHAEVTATWAARAPTHERSSVATSSVWGTGRADAVAILQSSLNQTPITVYDPHPDDPNKRVINPAETLAAREKQEILGQRFSEWVWEDPARAERLAAEYNRLFNSTVLPRYDGSHLTLPGLAATFKPHGHQRDAVWRVISEPTNLLAHDVGAGKTATMAMASQELRRLGLVKKPCFVVPNHMLDQFSREFSQLYPQAKVLVATKEDTTAEARKGFVARCATGDWDAVVMTQSAFARIPVSDETRKKFVDSRLAELRKAIAASEDGERLTVKRLEARVAQLEATHAKLLDSERKDDGVTFEKTGIDYLFVDEAHHFKNRQFATHMNGVGGRVRAGPRIWNSSWATCGSASAPAASPSLPLRRSPTASRRCGWFRATFSRTAWPQREWTPSTPGRPPSDGRSPRSSCPRTAAPTASTPVSRASPTCPSC